MTTAILDGQHMWTVRDLHRSLSQQLDFGPYYGNNPSALWDRLTTDVERPVRIMWTSAFVSRERFGAEMFDKIVEIFQAAAARDEGKAPSERLTVDIQD